MRTEKEMMELDEEENFKELLKKIINDLNNIFEKKKPRKTKIKKEEWFTLFIYQKLNKNIVYLVFIKQKLIIKKI